jgi:sugar phosphate isomerase/epimerase
VDEAAMPTLKVAKTLWGVDEATDTGKWDALFARIASEGFDGVEVIAPTWRADPALLTSLLTKHGLALICQLHTTGGDIVGGEYVYCSSCKLDDHVASFEALATT